MQGNRAIVWFRQDLRLHDNEALTEAITNAREIVPVYVFDIRIFGGKTHFGFPKIGAHRTKFVIESVANLRKNLQALGSNLLVRIGKPEEEVFLLAKELKTSWVFCNRERMHEELQVQDKLEQKLWSVGQELRFARGKMLYHTADLPFPIPHTPDVFTQFRKEVERYVTIRTPYPTPTRIAPYTCTVTSGQIPTLETFGMDEPEYDPRGVMPFTGGETAGLLRLQEYLDSGLIRTYKETRNGLTGADYSSKFSPWLAQGCLSPKKVYEEIKKHEQKQGANESTYWLVFELMWRDFFRFMGKKHGNLIFKPGGTRKKPPVDVQEDWVAFEHWMNGETGIPFIDANMKELAKTGYMSNRGRQNVASFLVKDLKINWLMGAEYFESMLIDYDVCSNYGNWNYIAGVGSDPREDRYFNILTQARKYDPDGTYVKHWLPELSDVPAERIHQPETFSPEEQQEWHLQLGQNYPLAMVNTSKWE